MAEAAAPVACRLGTFGGAERARHRQLAAELLAAASDIEELPDGYAVLFPAKPYLFLRIAEWIDLERTCCPFLTIRLEIEPSGPALRVRLTGPAGAKDVLRAELPLLRAGAAG